MPIKGQGWEIEIRRLREQKRGRTTRTVGTYQVFHDGRPAGEVILDGVTVPLSGTTVECGGPSQNDKPATAEKPSRIVARRYPLATSGGPTYVTNGYREDLAIRAKMPGIEVLDTGKRTAILIHPGKNEFLSSIGCINLCTRLPNAQENIDYPGSRRRVIALIEDMRRFLGGIPVEGDRPIPNAFAEIDESGLGAAVASSRTAEAEKKTVDGNEIAASLGVAVKSKAVKIASLHPAMEPVITAVAKSASKLGLPVPVITSGNDSRHKRGSLHFLDRALDFRGNNISDAKGKALEAEVARRLGEDYDVIFEIFPALPLKDHLHVEYDPR